MKNTAIKRKKKKSYYRYKSIMGLERAVYDEQIRLTKKKFGASAADSMNLGWGVSGDDDGVSVCSKVYGYGKLQTDARVGMRKMDFEHEWLD